MSSKSLEITHSSDTVVHMRSKLRDREEFLRWYRDGRSYQWIVNEYLRKYDTEISTGTPANWLVQLGEPARRNVWDASLLPWSVRPEHRQSRVYKRLQSLARRRAGYELPEATATDLDSWLYGLRRDSMVIRYDPDTEEGWLREPRRAADQDIVRLPLRADRRLQRG